VHLKAN